MENAADAVRRGNIKTVLRADRIVSPKMRLELAVSIIQKFELFAENPDVETEKRTHFAKLLGDMDRKTSANFRAQEGSGNARFSQFFLAWEKI